MACPYGGNCEFVFDPSAHEYDWLVVYDDLPARRGERPALREEPLACPREYTMLVTVEPSSIKAYGNDYTARPDGRRHAYREDRGNLHGLLR